MRVTIFLCFLALVSTQCDSDCWKSIRDYRKKCMELLEFTDDEKSILARWEYPNNEPRRDIYVGQIWCVGNFTGLWSDWNGWDIPKMEKMLQGKGDPENIHELLTGCADKNPQRSHSDKWAWRTWTCMVKTDLRQMIENDFDLKN